MIELANFTARHTPPIHGRRALWGDIVVRQAPRLALCTAIAWLVAVSSVSAATVYVERATPNDNGRGITYHGTNNGGSRAFWWGGQRLVNMSDSPTFNSYEEIGVFCFEPYADLFKNPNDVHEYTLGTLDEFEYLRPGNPPAAPLTNQQKDLLLKLADNAYPVLLDDNTPDDFAIKATAYQVVLWEILNDAGANPLSLTNGLTRVDFTTSGPNPDDPWVADMRDLANSWIAALNADSWSVTGQYEYQMLLSDEWQALGYLVEVPEPSSFVLAGLAMAAVVVVRRRRRT